MSAETQIIRRAPEAAPPPEEEGESFIGTVGGGLLSGIGMLSNVLSLPGSMVVDTLALDNPFDQLLSPLSGENRTSGRDMMAKWGLLSENKETGWVPLEDPGEFAQDALGFGVELLLDPLGWATGWLKAGRLASGAADAATATSGIRRASERFGDVVDRLDPGHRLGMAAHGSDALRGVAGRAGEQISSGLDAIRRTRPYQQAAERLTPFANKVRVQAAEAFDHRVRSATTGPVQAGARVATEFEQMLMTEYRDTFVPVLDELVSMSDELDAGVDVDGWATGMAQDIRHALESRGNEIDPERLANLPENLHEPLRQMKAYNQVLLDHAQRVGLNVQELEDEMIGFLHRQMSDRNKEWLRRNEPGAVKGSTRYQQQVNNAEHQSRRHQLLKDGETAAFDEVLSDPEAHRLLDEAHEYRNTDPDIYEELIEGVADRLREVAGDRIMPDMKVTNGDNFVMNNSAGDQVSMGARELREMQFDSEIQVGDRVQWTNGGAWQFAEPQTVESLVQHDGHWFATFEGQKAGAPLGELNHWDDVIGDVRDTSRTRRVREETRVVRDAEGNPIIDEIEVDGRTVRRQRTEQFIETYEHETADRFTALAEHMMDRPVYLENGGLFSSPFHGMLSGVRAAVNSITNARATTETIVDGFNSGILQMPSEVRGHTMTLDKLFDSASLSAMDRRVVYNQLVGNNNKIIEHMQANGLEELFDENNLNAFYDYIGSIQLDPDIAADIQRTWDFKTRPDTAGVKGTIENTFRSFTSLFKAGVLTHPSRYNRDGVSGQIQNMTHGIFSFQSLKNMFNVLFNRADESLLDIAPIREFMERKGMELTAANATKAARQMYSIRRGHSSSVYHDIDTLAEGMESAEDFNQLRESLLGTINGPVDLLREIGATAIGRRGGNFDPRNIAGFNLRRESTFAPVQAGELAGRYMDDANRLVGFIESMRKGVDADEAMRIVDNVQLNYDPKTFTPTEQALKRFFPFYSFFSREMAYLGQELWHNPAGRLGKLIRLQGKADSPEQDGQYVPEHVRAQMALPLGDSKDGGKNYLTGLGLMHEDPISTIMGGIGDPQAGMRNLISKTNPLIKGFAEFGLGRSSFQGGPLGGRDLHDMDPNVGRILTQLGIQDATPSGRAAPFLSRGFEFAVSNSPASRVVSSTKTALDSRKSPLERLLNLTTGLRITTVSPEQSRSALRDIGNAIARDAGARAFSTFHINDEMIESFEGYPEVQKKLKAVQAQREKWNQESREIRRDKKAKEKEFYRLTDDHGTKEELKRYLETGKIQQ